MRIILIICGLFTVCQVFSQSSEKQYKPLEGQGGIVFNVAGIISNISIAPIQDPIGNSLILGRYHVRDKHVIRVGLGLKSFSNKVSLVDSVGGFQRTSDSTYKKFNFYLSPSYEYHMKGLNRLDPYVGAGINLGILGKTNIAVNSEMKDTTGSDKSKMTYTKEGGFMFGFNGIIGFNYFIAQNFALGAEYTLGFYSVRDGGDWERVTQLTPVSGTGTSKREVGSERTLLSGFDHSNNLSITLSYYFGQPKSTGN